MIQHAKTLLTSATALLMLATSVQDEMPSNEMNDIINGEHRSDANKVRNEYRHPQETLAFFGLEPDMTVIELWPGGGWYTEILAPFLAADGQLIAAHFDADGGVEYYTKSRQKFDQKIQGDEHYKQVKTVAFNPGVSAPMTAADAVDMVLTFRSLHNWLGAEKLDVVLADVYKSLKPGGVFGVVEHRADATAPVDPKASKGYVNQGEAIRLIEAAGFKLVAISDINDNPADSADHANGVWTLPPTLRVPEGEDVDKYKKIGESDRFTLKFIKPKQ